MKLNSFYELFLYLLSDIYTVEKQLLIDIPKMANKAHSKELNEGMQTQIKEIKAQVERLDSIFGILNEQPKNADWAGDLKRLFVDADQLLKGNTPSPLLDAAIIAVTQRIKHFEIATYRTLITYADILDLEEVKDILRETLDEEGHADKLLSKLAEGGVFKEGINLEAKHRK